MSQSNNIGSVVSAMRRAGYKTLRQGGTPEAAFHAANAVGVRLMGGECDQVDWAIPMLEEALPSVWATRLAAMFGIFDNALPIGTLSRKAA